MDIATTRALIAVLIRGQHIQKAILTRAVNFRTEPHEVYLGVAQEILTSSYKNFSHPVDPATQGVGGPEWLEPIADTSQ